MALSKLLTVFWCIEIKTVLKVFLIFFIFTYQEWPLATRPPEGPATVPWRRLAYTWKQLKKILKVVFSLHCHTIHSASTWRRGGRFKKSSSLRRQSSTAGPLSLHLKPNSWTYISVEVSGHNLESSQTWDICLHYKPVSNHFCSRGRGSKICSRGDCK